MLRPRIDVKDGGAGSFDRRTVWAAVALAAAWLAASVVGFVTTAAWLPGLAPQSRALLVLSGLTVLLVAFLAATDAWRSARVVATGGRSAWGLLALPLVLVLAPLVGGVHLPALGPLSILLVGYALTGFTEETFFRGVVLGVLRPGGAVRAVVLSSLLFGMVHLGNVFVRPSVALVVAQAVGAVCFGIAYGALRLRLATIWPLIALHALHDLLLRVGGLPVVPTDVVQDVVLLIYGIVLLRRPEGGEVPTPTPA